MFVGWVLPYSLAGIYDFLQGQGFLSATYPILSQIIPIWLPPIWLIIGAIAFLILTFEGAYRITQRKLMASNGKTTQKEERDYALIWLNPYFYLKDSQGNLHSYDSTDEVGKISLVLNAAIRVNTLKMIEIQSLALDIGTEQIPSNWDDTNVFFESETVDDVRFIFPLSTPRGKQIAKIKAIVNGEEYISSQFIIDFPKRIA